MRTIKIIARTYEKKAGGSFPKLSIGGKYLPLALAEEEVQYQVKFTAKSDCKEPTVSGIYEIAYADGDLWLDTRPENEGKNIVRVTAHRCVFSKQLPRLEKDIREVK